MALGPLEIPTFVPLMALYLALSLAMTLTGGQLTIMVTDCIEGMVSMFLFLVVIGALLIMFSKEEFFNALAAADAAKPMLNPYDTGAVKDFNIWYVLIGIFGSIYGTMAWQGGHAFNSSARNAHESKMAAIISTWRGFSRGLFGTLIALAAYTYLVHPDFSAGAARVQEILSSVDNPQIVKQMRMPVALGLLLPMGIKGTVCALFLLGLIACDGSYLHSWGSILIQDVVLPLRKEPLGPSEHLRLLRVAIVGVALFGFLFSAFFRQTDYILMFFAITGAIYVGGAGSVIVGGLYWKKGTTAAAWTAMTIGSGLALLGAILQQPMVWKPLAALLNGCGVCLPDAFPINGQWMNFIAMVSAASSYVVVSLLTCKEDFNMDRMLHRGAYAVKDDPAALAAADDRRFRWGRFIGIDAQYTRFDKVMAVSVFGWKMLWMAVAALIVLWNVFDRWPLRWWFNYFYTMNLWVALILIAPTTVWFTWGGIRDLTDVFRTLRQTRLNARDDGRVVDHQNVE